jgi:hypothetical protein
MASCGGDTHLIHGLVASAVATALALVFFFIRHPQHWTKDQWEGAREAMYEAILAGFLEGCIVSWLFCTWPQA